MPQVETHLPVPPSLTATRGRTPRRRLILGRRASALAAVAVSGLVLASGAGAAAAHSPSYTPTTAAHGLAKATANTPVARATGRKVK